MNKFIILLCSALLFGCNGISEKDFSNIQDKLNNELKNAVFRSGKAFGNKSLTVVLNKVDEMVCDKNEQSNYCVDDAEKNVKYYFTLNVPNIKNIEGRVLIRVDDGYTIDAKLNNNEVIPIPLSGNAYYKNDKWIIDSFTRISRGTSNLTFTDIMSALSSGNINVNGYDNEALTKYLDTGFVSHEKVSLSKLGQVPKQFYFITESGDEVLVVERDSREQRTYKNDAGMIVTERGVSTITRFGVCDTKLEIVTNDPESSDDEKEEFLAFSAKNCYQMTLNPFTYPKVELTSQSSGSNLDMSNVKLMRDNNGSFVDARTVVDSEKFIVKEFGNAEEKLNNFLNNFKTWDDFPSSSADAKLKLEVVADYSEKHRLKITINKSMFHYSVSFDDEPNKLPCNWDFAGSYLAKKRVLCRFDGNTYLYKRSDNKYAVLHGGREGNIEFIEK